MATDPWGLTGDEFATLRRAAALAHGVGSIGLTIHAGPTVVARVTPYGAQIGSGGAGEMHPCSFRSAVGRAWAEHSAGRPVGLAGCRGAGRVQVSWSVEGPGALLGFDAVRAPCGGRTVWAFASLLAPDELGPVLGAIPDGGDGSTPASPTDLAAHLVRDDVLETTLVHIEADSVAPATSRLFDEALYRMLAACAVAEIELSCRRGSRRSSGR